MKNQMYKVKEIFASIQGEGGNTGMYAAFIRFAGCNYQCPFCDEHHEEPFIEYTAHELMTAVRKLGVRNVIFTGGEPMLQLDEALIKYFHLEGYYMTIETNGQLLNRQEWLSIVDWITVSPKKMLDFSRIDCDEYKVVIVDNDGFAKTIVKRLLKESVTGSIYIQPEWNRKEETLPACFSLIREFPEVRLSVQTHKYIGVQ